MNFSMLEQSISITILDLAKTIIKSSGLDIELNFGPALNGDVQRSVANIDLIQDKIGWKPTVFLEKWIDEIISMKNLTRFNYNLYK